MLPASTQGVKKRRGTIIRQKCDTASGAYPGGLWGPRPPEVTKGAPKRKGKKKRKEEKKKKEKEKEERKEGDKKGKDW